MGSQDPSTSHDNRWPVVIFIVLLAVGIAISAVSVLRGLSFPWPLIAAAAGGVFVYVVIHRSDAKLGWSYVCIVLLMLRPVQLASVLAG
jgi:hypothetical protein